MTVPGGRTKTDGSGLSGRGAQPLALLAAVVAIGCCWPLIARLVPAGARFAFTDLLREHWAHRDPLQPWLDRRWAWLAAQQYHLWFALAALPGVLAAGAVQSVRARNALPLVVGPLGWSGGTFLGWVLFEWLQGGNWPLAVMMPALSGFLGGTIASRVAAPSGGAERIRGTDVRPFRFGPAKRFLARHRGQLTVAGVPVALADETLHLAAIGATGSGKSTALRELMGGAIARGDRHVVADPEGAALAAFGRPGDIILNPFDPRCARWDLLGEIERPSDYAFLAQSLLPHLGTSEHDQWISYAQQLLAGLMENFVRLELGPTRGLVAMLQNARIHELKELCAGTPAARYFEEGGERMLASILGTLAPAIGHLRAIDSIAGEPFSLRRWIREGRGSLWLPYKANEIAALRGLVSCWLNIAILETLSLETSDERRIWFHIDELDALGRIEGLKDALARLRKFGGCVALGFQSFAQVKQIYGEGAHTLVENCGNLLLLRSGASADGGTAKLASELIGSREVLREEQSRSRTRARSSSSSTASQTRHAVELAALASELTVLQPGRGFLKRAGDSHWLRL